MMQLYCERDKEEGAFDDLFKGVDRSSIRKIVECHYSEDDDSNYVFLVWADWTDASQCGLLMANAHDAGAELHWLAPGLVAWCEDVTT